VIRNKRRSRRESLPDVPDVADVAEAQDEPVALDDAIAERVDPVELDESPAHDEGEADEPKRLRGRLRRARGPFKKMRGRMRARRIDDEVWDDLEETLLLADAGLDTTARLVDAVRTRAAAEATKI
jgi:fused signal recognition particle receptor